jgi:hypothetical protein
VRIVGAEISRFDPRGQVAAERWDDLCDPLDCFFDPLSNYGTRPLCTRRSPTIPASKSNGSYHQLLGYGIHLASGHGSPVGIVKPLSFLQIVPQLVNPALVFCLGL